MKKRHLIAAAIVVAVVAVVVLLWVNEGPLWRMVMLKTIILPEYTPKKPLWDAHPLRGWATARRWVRPHPERFLGTLPELYGKSVFYFTENGFKAFEEYSGREEVRTTYWNFNGKVHEQSRFALDEVETRKSPPWLWGVTDQTEPTAPWWGKE